MKIFRIVFLLFVFSNTSCADENIRKISVTGKSKISLEAQYSVIHAELKYVKIGVDESFNELQTGIIKLSRELKGEGLSDNEITKSIVNQGPEYTWEKNSRKLIGYFASCSMQFRVNDLDNLKNVYRKLAKYNALSINWTEYGRNDEFDIRNQEFKKALLAAKEKAKFMAKNLDVEIGSVITIKEISSNSVGVRSQYTNSNLRDDNLGKFGSVDIVATVMVEFELK